MPAAYCGARGLPRTITVEPMLTIAPLPALEHALSELVHHQHRALDVDGEHVVDRLLGDLAPGRLLGGHVADVVDEHVERAERVEGLRGHPLDVLPGGDVALHEERLGAGGADALGGGLGPAAELR